MSKLLVIKKSLHSCSECSHYAIHGQKECNHIKFFHYVFSENHLHEIKNPNEIPSWCPLEDDNETYDEKMDRFMVLKKESYKEYVKMKEQNDTNT